MWTLVILSGCSYEVHRAVEIDSKEPYRFGEKLAVTSGHYAGSDALVRSVFDDKYKANCIKHRLSVEIRNNTLVEQDTICSEDTERY